MKRDDKEFFGAMGTMLLITIVCLAIMIHLILDM